MASLFVPVDPPTGIEPAPEEHTEHWMPTEMSIGPWSEESLHGGPVAALVARALERLDAPVPMRLTRLTLELLRPVPVVPLWLSAAVVRPGRKVGMLEATLGRADDGKVLAVARAQRIRTTDLDFPDGVTDDVPGDPWDVRPAAVGAVTPSGSARAGYHNAGVEHRFLRGEFGRPGPAFDWVRLTVPVVPDEEPTGWQRAAAIADFANGVSSVVPFGGNALFINPDLTVNLWREPVGEWIGLEAHTRTASDGIGMSDTALWDDGGRVGRATQSLLLDR